METNSQIQELSDEQIRETFAKHYNQHNDHLDVFGFARAILATRQPAPASSQQAGAAAVGGEIIGWYKDTKIDVHGDSQNDLPPLLIDNRVIIAGKYAPRGNGWKPLVDAAHPPADAAPRSAAHTDSVLLQELLARIHRDGGHHAAEVGTEQAVKNADLIIASLHAAPVDAKPQLDMEVLGALLDQVQGMHGTVVQNAYCPSSEPFKAAQKRFYSAVESLRSVLEIAAQPSTAQGDALSQQAGGIYTWQERMRLSGPERPSLDDFIRAADAEIADLRAALAQRAASQPEAVGIVHNTAGKFWVRWIKKPEDGMRLYTAQVNQPDSELDAARYRSEPR